MEIEKHTLMDGRLHVYRRENSRFWQCSTYLGRRNHRESTKEESLSAAKEFAREWYMERFADERRRRRGLPLYSDMDANAATEDVADRRRKPRPTGPTFREAVEAFQKETAVITAGERSAYYMTQKDMHIRVHLLPFFGDEALSEINAGRVQDYRVHRATPRVSPRNMKPLIDPDTGKPQRDPKTGEILKDPATGVAKRPSRSTLHQETVTLRQILKMANRKGWLAALPDMSVPYKKSGKISHRAWFSPEEYKKLYKASGERAENPKKERWRAAGKNLHDYILIMANTGLRPDEALRLEYQDVAIVTDDATGKRILEIAVRGKRGVGWCKSMPGAVHPFARLKKRNEGQPTDRLFPSFQRELFNTLLHELDLRTDREGQRRTAYSLRHTYICMRLMEGADIYQIAKNCRTSVEMIENFYASHIKNTLDAAAINVRKPKRAASKVQSEKPSKPKTKRPSPKSRLASPPDPTIEA